jgi:hypothetical protein
MRRQLLSTFLLLAAASGASAHFVFVLPQSGGTSARIVMNEELKPSSEVDIGIIAGLKLSVRKGNGSETPLALVKGENFYEALVPGTGTRLLHGIVDLGMLQSGPGKPNILIYYPKAIAGDAFSAKTVVGDAAPVEIVPVGKPGSVTLKLLVMGKPKAEAEITVILPDGSQQKVKTDANGISEHQFTQTGRYGAWARDWQPSAGERDGKRYEEIRNYATLVFDAGTATVQSTATKFATLPEATSSFGAAVSGGWLYVYGGHVAKTHSYSTESVSGLFERLPLSGDGAWEKLPGGPGLQGMNLVSFEDKLYRIGGMSPRNKPGEPQAIYSVADCARFDPSTKKWEPLPALPEPLSSHDMVVINGKLIVAGGWNLTGSTNGEWSTSLHILDLKAARPEWKSAPQPFKRRALIAAALDGKMYVLGGIDDTTDVSHDVDIYDPETGVWTKGPAVPGDEISSFAPAACVHGGTLYVSVADGTVYGLDTRKKSWEKVGAASPRLAHRMVSDGKQLLVMGGAEKGNNSDLVEAVAVRR